MVSALITADNPTPSPDLKTSPAHHLARRRGRRVAARGGPAANERLVRPTRIPTPTATPRVRSGRCSTSVERRRNASLLRSATSLPSFAASSLTEWAPPRNRSAILLNTGARAAPAHSATSAALADVLLPTRCSCFSSDAKRCSVSLNLGSLAREYPD